MHPTEAAHEILETMLGHLGYQAQIDLEEAPTGPVLQVSMEHADDLIGARGERLEDLQYLVNRLLQVKLPDAPKIRVDVAHLREMREDEMLTAVHAAAARVRATRSAVNLPPMNSFHRRMVHNLFIHDPEIKSTSPEERRRLKRITLSPR